MQLWSGSKKVSAALKLVNCESWSITTTPISASAGNACCWSGSIDAVLPAHTGTVPDAPRFPLLGGDCGSFLQAHTQLKAIKQP